MKDHQYIHYILDYVQKYYLDDIDCVVAYGSYTRDEMTEFSDIDLFFIPSTESGYQAAFQAIIQNIGYDFFPVSWERLSRMAQYDDAFSSLLLEGQVIYYRNQLVLTRYEELRKKCVLFNHFEEKIPSLIHEMKYLFFDYPTTTAEILYKSCQAIAYYNHTCLRRGMMDFEHELLSLSKPNLMIENIKLLIESPNQSMLKRYIYSIENYVSQKQETPPLNSGFYEELKSLYQKGHHQTSVYTQYFIKAIIENETSSYLGDRYKMPKCTNHFTDWLTKHEETLVRILNKEEIMIHQYKDFEEFKNIQLKL